MSRLLCSLVIVICTASLLADTAMKGDYEGDGKDDVVLFLQNQPYGNWRISLSSTNFLVAYNFFWGVDTDIPLSGDFDGDGIMDPTVFRGSTRTVFILKSTCNRTCYSQFTMPDAP